MSTDLLYRFCLIGLGMTQILLIAAVVFSI